MEGKSLLPNRFEGKFLQPTIWRLIKPFKYTFSYMTYLMNHVICLNNIPLEDFMSCHVMGQQKFFGEKLSNAECGSLLF